MVREAGRSMLGIPEGIQLLPQRHQTNRGSNVQVTPRHSHGHNRQYRWKCDRFSPR